MRAVLCLTEVNRTVKAAGLDDEDVHAAVVGFARNLARRIDKVGVDEAPLNLLRMYQGALANLQRAATPKPAPKSTSTAADPGLAEQVEPVGPPELKIVEESPLARVRREKAEARAAG